MSPSPPTGASSTSGRPPSRRASCASCRPSSWPRAATPASTPPTPPAITAACATRRAASTMRAWASRRRARTRWRDETFDDRRAVEGDKPDLSVGQRVFHQKFGYGRIVAVDGNKLDIEFEKAGAEEGARQLHRGGVSLWTAWRDVAAADRAGARAGARAARRERLRRHQPRDVARRAVAHRDLRRGRQDRGRGGDRRRLAVGGTARAGLGGREPALVQAVRRRPLLGSSLARRATAGRPGCCRSGSMPAWRSAPARTPRRAAAWKCWRRSIPPRPPTPSMSAAAAASSPSPWPSCGSAPVIGGDNDAEAVEVARDNAGLNGVGRLCRFVHADRPAARRNWRAARPYDLIVANILAGPLIELVDFVRRRRTTGRPRAAERPAGRAGRRCPRGLRPQGLRPSASSTSKPAARGGARCCWRCPLRRAHARARSRASRDWRGFRAGCGRHTRGAASRAVAVQASPGGRTPRRSRGIRWAAGRSRRRRRR